MKTLSFGQKFLSFLVVATFFTLANYTLTVHRENERLTHLVEIADMRSAVNSEFVDELLWARFNDVEHLTEQNLVAQGRIEGVIDYINNDNSTYIDQLWHEGYQRGLTQVDFERELISKNSFEQGYQKGKKENFFVSDEDKVNTSPREVNEEAIKQPEFDVKSNLPENSEVIENLNEKIDELKEKADS